MSMLRASATTGLHGRSVFVMPPAVTLFSVRQMKKGAIGPPFDRFGNLTRKVVMRHIQPCEI